MSEMGGRKAIQQVKKHTHKAESNAMTRGSRKRRPGARKRRGLTATSETLEKWAF